MSTTIHRTESDDGTFHLIGRLVTVLPFVESNITEEYVSWLTNPELMKYSNQRFRAHSIESCKDYLRSFKDTHNLFCAIYHQARYIGTMTAYVSKHHATADMGILIGRSRGKGFGTDAWVTLMEYLFQIGIRKISGGTLRCNSAMVKIMLSSGMRTDGIRTAHELVDGRPEDILHFAKFNS